MEPHFLRGGGVVTNLFPSAFSQRNVALRIASPSTITTNYFFHQNNFICCRKNKFTYVTYLLIQNQAKFYQGKKALRYFLLVTLFRGA